MQNATGVVARKVVSTNEYWENDPKPENLSWGTMKTSLRNRLFEAVKQELVGEVYSNGQPFKITYTAFEWKMKQATTYRLSGKHTSIAIIQPR